MTIQDILNYIKHTPDNTNVNVLKPMLEELQGSRPSPGPTSDKEYQLDMFSETNGYEPSARGKLLRTWQEISDNYPYTLSIINYNDGSKSTCVYRTYTKKNRYGLHYCVLTVDEDEYTCASPTDYPIGGNIEYELVQDGGQIRFQVDWDSIDLAYNRKNARLFCYLKPTEAFPNGISDEILETAIESGRHIVRTKNNLLFVADIPEDYPSLYY